jgi:hypothetical protein
MVALKMAQGKVAHKKTDVAAQNPSLMPTNVNAEPDDPITLAGFHVSPITIEKTAGTSLRHAVGTLTNDSDRQRFGVQIQLDLFNESGQKIDSTKDYQQVIEPKAEWKFNAPVMTPKATSVKATSVTEQK